MRKMIATHNLNRTPKRKSDAISPLEMDPKRKPLVKPKQRGTGLFGNNPLSYRIEREYRRSLNDLWYRKNQAKLDAGRGEADAETGGGVASERETNSPVKADSAGYSHPGGDTKIKLKRATLNVCDTPKGWVRPKKNHQKRRRCVR